MRTLKRIALSLAAVVVAFSWSSTGRAQAVPAPCVVERGQDPLDVLNTGVRHNLWIVLDASGSMGDRITLPDGTQSSQNKMQIAKDAINQVMDNLVDSAGRPLVNWGFAHYRDQTVFPVDGVPACPSPLVPPDGNADNYPDTPHGCTGLEDAAFIDPGTCAQDSRELVRSVLNPLRQFRGTGGQSQRTPIGVAFSDFGEYITGRHRPDLGASGNRINFVDTLLPGQKNFLVHITDGLETCECDRGGYPQARLSPLLNSVTMRPSQFDPNQITTATAQDDFRVYNAALKGEWTLKQIDPTLDGSKGNVFVVGFDIQNAIDQGRINTVAWMSSGAGLSPQRDPKLMHSAFFANQPDELEEALRRIVGEIGIPETDVTLGASVVGSVKEVIHSHTNTNVARADVIPNDLTDADAIREARAIRADHQNNVLFSTSAEVPGFRGHLRATSIYTVTDPNLPRTARQADFTEIWDAGDVLQSTDPDTRMMFFNLPGTATVRPFTPAEVIASGLDLGVGRGYLSELDGAGAQDVDDAVEIVVQVMRGYHLSIDPVTRTIYKNNGTLNLSKTDSDGNDTWKLWESVGGPSLALNPPRSPDFDPPLNHSTEYGVGGSVEGDGFFWDHFNRRTVVYYTANPGILHGFSAETGEELFAFLPDDALELADLEADRDTIADFVRDVVTDNNNVLNHKFILASPPVVADVFLRSDVGAGTQRGDDAWH
ncbi:MAG TPA: hypothetical protein VEK15_15920, partial [Vicinamibacteria bacterium]|nr:hypothetical protein [Vicinamibacteria bacterium]